jgi:hypothetical protein
MGDLAPILGMNFEDRNLVEGKGMQGVVHESRLRIGRPLAFALALLSLLFLLQVTPHTHTNGQDEAACGLCQAAHVGATPAVSGIVLSVPLVAVGKVSAPIVLAANENFFLHSDPRGPPVEVQQ